jgi:alpha-mannosidase
LKSPKEPDATADMGAHSFVYSLLPHQGDLEAVIAEATALNIPYRVTAGNLSDARRLLRLDGNGVQVDAFKRAEDGDGYVLRVHEVLGGRAEATLTSDFGVARSAPCNLLEDVTGEKTDGSAIEIRLRPFEIQNFRVWFK